MSGSGASSGQHELNTVGSSNIRQIHEHINITDTQFDAFIDCFRDSCREFGLTSEASKEFLAVLDSLRCEVIIGWTLRSSEARDRADQARDGKYESFFDQMGGRSTDPGLEGFLGRVYELVERDKRINEFFLGAKFNSIREAQGRFLLSILGGPLVISRHLADVHKIYRITDYHFDCFVGDVIHAARDCGAPEEVRDDLACILEPFRSVVVIGSRQTVA
jgi:truncated hemoglobin YjbI